MIRGKLAACLVLALLFPLTSLADSISPASVSASIDVGQTITIDKTVTVTSTPGEYAPVDVYFLADTTGSMGGEIDAVQAGAAAIMSGAAGLGDIQFAVGEYEDWGSTYSYYPSRLPSDYTDDPYTLHQDFTSNTTSVQTGIDKWDDPLGYGDDSPESQIYALEQAAETASWRDGSTRILVWFGDAYGHDPSGPSTEATATAALVDNNITVEAISVGGSLGVQATRIATATSGHHYSGIVSSTIVQTISDAISTVVNTYSTVGIDLSAVPAGLSASVSPADYTGSYDRSTDRTFDFTVTLEGLAEGVYDFDIYGTVDGSRVATERDSITVGGAAPVPEPSTLLLLGVGLAGLGYYQKRRKNS